MLSANDFVRLEGAKALEVSVLYHFLNRPRTTGNSQIFLHGPGWSVRHFASKKDSFGIFESMVYANCVFARC